MKRCKLCVMPDTRPGLEFVDGVCSACRNAANQPQIDWDARGKELLALLDRHNGRCIVPSSGGKDSSYQVHTLLRLGADVTIVTAATCHLTDIGRHNIDNLARFARTIEVSPNKTVRAKLNRLGLELVGDISHPEHLAIFSTPFRVACQLGIPLIFYGESPTNAYGGPPGSEEVKTMTRRWVAEHGGLLGLRAADFVGMEGITERDMQDYSLPADSEIERVGVEAHFLGQYIGPWDSHRNASIAVHNGMQHQKPYEGNWWHSENQDNAQTGLHDHGMYRKFGFSRFASQISVDLRNGRSLVRHGKSQREAALALVHKYDGLFPTTYMGVHVDKVLERIELSRSRLMEILDQFTDWDLFSHVENGRPILKCSQSESSRPSCFAAAS